MTSEAPHVFVSSTISDFADLRSALKYWLEGLGFVVQMSEYADFEHRPEAGAFDACFENIRRADFYVLLIGGRVGSLFNQTARVSVTQQEYRTAYAQFLSTGSPQIISFVRRHPSAFEDERWTEDFIREVRRDNPNAAANWTIPLAGFDDLVAGLRSAVPAMRDSLAKQAVLQNLRQEMEYNLRSLLWKHNGRAFYPTWVLEDVRREVRLTKQDFREEKTLTHRHVKLITMYLAGGVPAGELFIEDALTSAILSGVLLDFDKATKQFVPSSILGLLYALQDEFASFRRRARSLEEAFRRRWFENWERIRRNADATVAVSADDLLTLFAIHDTQVNVQRLILAVAVRLYGHDPGAIQLRPSSPIAGMQDEIERERVSADEMQQWLAKDDPILRTSLYDVPIEQQERSRELYKDMETIFGVQEMDDWLHDPSGAPDHELSAQDVERLRDALNRFAPDWGTRPDS